MISLVQDYQRLLASQSVRRLNPAKVSESAALKTKLVDTIAFLESLAVKDSNEKDLFFKRLPATLPSLPMPVVQKKVSPHLLVSVCGNCLPLGASLSWLRCHSIYTQSGTDAFVLRQIRTMPCWKIWQSLIGELERLMRCVSLVCALGSTQIHTFLPLMQSRIAGVETVTSI